MKNPLLALLIVFVVSNQAEFEHGVRAPWFEMGSLKENQNKDQDDRRAYSDVNHQLVSILEQYFTEQLIRHKANVRGSSFATRAQGEETPGIGNGARGTRQHQFQLHQQRQHENFVALRG